MSRVTIKVNGGKHAVEATPDTPLLYVLRNELRLHGPRFGCGLAQCGACTVRLGKQAIRSCVTPVASVQGQDVITLEGLGTAEKPHPLQTAFIKHQAAQCGYCLSAHGHGRVVVDGAWRNQATTSDAQNPDPDEAVPLSVRYALPDLAAIKDAAKGSGTAAGGTA